MITTPVTFRQSATDADNHLRTNLAAAYVQDQIDLSRHLQLVGGIRFDRFDLLYHNNRTGDDLERPDNLVSPRAGVVVKPIPALSLYGSYSVSYLPSSGDQFSSLTTITQQVEPERFNNYEAGVKWDARPGCPVTTALYRLDRTNTRSTDPNDPTRIIQTGSQRTNGYELGTNGQVTPAWSIAGGYAYQNAFVTSATTAAAAGALVGQVPHHTFSLWNRYQFQPRLSAGLGRALSLGHVRRGRQHGDAAGIRASRRSRLLCAHQTGAAPGQRGEPVRQAVLHQRGQQHEHLARFSTHAPGGTDNFFLTGVGRWSPAATSA